MDNLAAIGLRIGSEASIRYRIGSVPGMGKTPNMRWIALYSQRGDRGWLLMADPDGKGGYFAVRNGYRIIRHGSQWSADEGNGGLATYAAMGKWATSLADRRAFTVKLVPVHKGCAVDR